MPRSCNHIGERFGKLVVIAKSDEYYITPRGTKETQWVCQCDCGNIVTVRGCQLTSGDTTSCGCKTMHDMTGERYGNLTVLRRSENVYTPPGGHNSVSKWICQCDCGNITEVTMSNLLNGSTTSCGCNHKTRDGLTTSKRRLSKIWFGMHDRCYNPHNMWYFRYGGRGIYICDEWRDKPGDNSGLRNFIEWAESHGYAEGLSIDRENADGPYSPDNCRWTNQRVQANNTRKNIHYTYNGRDYTPGQLSAITGLPYAKLAYRLRTGMTPNEAIEFLKGQGMGVNAVYFEEENGDFHG